MRSSRGNIFIGRDFSKVPILPLNRRDLDDEIVQKPPFYFFTIVVVLYVNAMRHTTFLGDIYISAYIVGSRTHRRVFILRATYNIYHIS